MLNRAKEFYEKEYKSTLQWLSSEYCKTPKDKKESIKNAIQRCLAIAIFVQDLGVSFEDIDSLYCEYRTKFYELLKRAEAMK